MDARIPAIVVCFAIVDRVLMDCASLCASSFVFVGWNDLLSVGFTYSEFYGNYRRSNVTLDRKVLAELAANEPFAFRSVVQVVKQQQKM